MQNGFDLCSRFPGHAVVPGHTDYLPEHAPGSQGSYRVQPCVEANDYINQTIYVHGTGH